MLTGALFILSHSSSAIASSLPFSTSNVGRNDSLETVKLSVASFNFLNLHEHNVVKGKLTINKDCLITPESYKMENLQTFASFSTSATI